MAVTLPQYLVLTGGPIPRVGLHKDKAGPQSPEPKQPCKGKVHGGNTFMATKKKAAKKKKKH
jgi:hypothetical protein